MKVSIIGGAAAGMGVAAKLLRTLSDAEITVYQDHDYVSLGACGLPYFISNSFNDENNMIARTPEWFKKNGVNVLTNTNVVSIDFNSRKLNYIKDGKEVVDSYDELVIATGAKPIVPNEYNGYENVYTLTSLEDGLRMKEEISKNDKVKNVLIVGAGFIGLELAENLKSIKKDVFVIEMQDQLLKNQYEKDYSDIMKDELVNNGVNLFLSNSVKKINETKNIITSVILSNDLELKVDAVVIAIGFKPATNFLNSSNLKMLGNGAIVVDEKGKTSISHVWSCGDCATTKDVLTNEDIYVPLATVAAKFSKVVAENIAGIKSEFRGSQKTSVLRLFEKGFVRTGMTESDAKLKNIKYKVVTVIDKDQTNYVNGQNDIALKLIMDVDKNVLIGGQMWGHEKAILRFNAIIDMIWNGVKVDEKLQQIDLPYSPPFSRTTDIISITLSKLI